MPRYQPGLTTNRIEAFSDGVFAIAITLLVLGIAVPELSTEELRQGGMELALVHLFPKILSFIIGFSIIGIFWMGHHIMFHYIRRADRLLILLNMLFLMTISFFPFPVALLGEYSEDLMAILLYGGTLFLSGIFFNLIWHHATKNFHLVDRNLNKEIVSLGKKIILLAPIAYGFALLLAFIAPRLSILLYILTPILYILPSPVDKLIHFAGEERKAL